jgi:hypothetical protein
MSKSEGSVQKFAGFPEGFYTADPGNLIKDAVVRLRLYQRNNPKAEPGKEHCSFTVWRIGAATFEARAKIKIRGDQVPASGDIYVTREALQRYVQSDRPASEITKPTKAMLDRQGEFSRRSGVDTGLLDTLFSAEPEPIAM